ncbi:MAG: hypothetical protein EOP92_20840 [Lysobacteraceae bacterium]|nr:MAG: hypothetical protein EOP92_20840 [Xanthomonadaceae bacterium]
MNQQFSGAAAIRAAMMIMGSTYITYALGLLTSILVARSLGPEGFGRYTYVVWIVGVLIAVGNNGLTTSAIRFVSESLGQGSLDSARSVHGWLQRRQFACLAIVAVAFIVLMPFFIPAGWEGHLGGFMAIAVGASLAKATFLFDVSVAKGYGKFGVEAKSTIGMSIINIVAVLVLVFFDAPLMGYLVLFGAISTGYAISSTVMLRRAGVRASREPLDAGIKPRLHKHLLWTVILTLSHALADRSVETYLLNALIGSAAVGFFAIAASLTKGGMDLLASGLSTVLMPMMAHAFGVGGQARVNVIMASAIRYFMFIGLLMAGVGTLVAAPAVALMYGASYAEVVTPLRVMILVGGLTMTTAAFNSLLSTTDNQHLRVVFAVLSIGVTFAFAIFLIPRYGLLGAVASHAASTTLIFVLMAMGITRVMRLRLPWRELLLQIGCALAAALVALVPVVLAPGNVSMVAGAVIFALVFVLSTALSKAWRASDIGHIVAFLERYPRVHERLGGPLTRWALRLPVDTTP